MFRMCARNSHSYTHLILALGIVREPTVWVFITPKYPGTHDIGLHMCSALQGHGRHTEEAMSMCGDLITHPPERATR